MKKRLFLLIALALAVSASVFPGRLSEGLLLVRAEGEVHGGTWRTYPNANKIQGLIVQGDWIWAATEGGVARWNTTDDGYVTYTTADGLVDDNVTALAIDGLGRAWFGTAYRGVSMLDGNDWTSYTSSTAISGPRSENVWDVAVDAAGGVWCACRPGWWEA